MLLLHRLGRVAGQLPLLLAAARRSGAGGSEVAALTRSWLEHGAERVALGPLPDAMVNRLVASLAGGDPGPALRGLVSGAAGRTFALHRVELAAQVVRRTAAPV